MTVQMPVSDLVLNFHDNLLCFFFFFIDLVAYNSDVLKFIVTLNFGIYGFYNS